MPTRAKLTAYETEHRTSRGISVAVGVLTLETPDGTIHQFPFISGGFGRGEAPALHRRHKASALPRPDAPELLARYTLSPLQSRPENAGMTAGGSHYFIPFATPGTGRSSLGIHPDGDTQSDMRRPLSGTEPIRRGDGKGDDGTNGCLGIASRYAADFQKLYQALGAARPTHIDFIAPPPDTPAITARQFFPNLRK